MIQIIRKEECCGCEVCANVCPYNCIRMIPDEKGFLYPQADREKCTDCQLCERVCPAASPQEPDEYRAMYAVQNKNEQIRKESTSGGAFSLIAEWVLAKRGVVIGAAFDGNFQVIHTAAERVEEIAAFRGSKYVQSHPGDIYRKTKSWLKEGRWVCFSGTPCQVNGLKRYLAQEYERLVTVDLACRGVTSPFFLKKYLSYHRQKAGKAITDVRFREKYYGYGYSTMKVGFSDGTCYRAGMESDIFLRSFFLDLNTRESCHECRFKTMGRVSDFTLFDGWHVRKFKREMDDDGGTTFCMIQSDKGMDIFKELREKCRFTEIPAEESLELDGKMIFTSVDPSLRREEFFRDIQKEDIPEIQNKYYPLGIKRRVLSCIKPAIYKTGLFRCYMKLKERRESGRKLH